MSVAERPLMVRWIVGSIPHGRLNELFLVPVVLDWYYKDRGMWVVRKKNSPCSGGSEFNFSLSGLLSYVRK